MLPMDSIAAKKYNKGEMLRFIKTNAPTKWSNLVVSQESLSGHKEGNPIWNPFNIADNLKETFPKGKVLIVVRNQFDYTLSLYAFRVYNKGIERRSLLGYLNKYAYPGLIEKLQYDKLVSYYFQVFGKKKVLVLPYELLRVDGERFLDQIAKFANVEKKKIELSARINASTKNYYIIEISRIINWPFSLVLEYSQNLGILPREHPSPSRFEKGYRLFKNKIIDPLLTKMFSQSNRKISIDSKWNSRLSPFFCESNRRLAKITNIDLEELGYPW